MKNMFVGKLLASTPVPALLLAALGLWPAPSATAQTATFNFDTGTPPLSLYQNIPVDQTVGDVTAHFSASVGSYSVQTAASLGGLRLSMFSGRFLVPGNTKGSVMEIQFNRRMTNITFAFATIQVQPIELETPIELDAYLDSTNSPAVGTTNASGVYQPPGGNTWPMGTLTFQSTEPFNLVRIWVPTIIPAPPTGQATDFVLDNITVATAPPPLTNVPPVILPVANQTVNAGAPISFTVAATDENVPAQALSFSLDPVYPAGAGITADGLFTWTPTQAQAPSTNVITVRVTDDGTPPLSGTASFTVVVNQTNVAPVLAAIPDQTATAGTLLTFTASATDANLPAQNLTFSLVPGYPAGASITAAGVFRWTPTAGQAPGTNVITVKVTDNGIPVLSNSKSFTVVVSQVNVAPVLSPITNQAATVGTLLTFTANATDANLPPQTLTFSLGPGYPDGASITAGGVFSWMPTQGQPATNLITVVVSDNGTPSLSATQSFTAILNHLPVPASPTLARAAGSGFKVRDVALLGTDPDGDTLVLSAVNPASTNGGSVTTNNGWVFYTPPAGVTNDDAFNYTVADGRGGFSVGTASIIVATNLGSSLNLSWGSLTNGQVRVRGDGIPQVTYTLEFTENLTTPVWHFLAAVAADAFGVFEYLDQPPAGAPTRFYRTSCP